MCVGEWLLHSVCPAVNVQTGIRLRLITLKRLAPVAAEQIANALKTQTAPASANAAKTAKGNANAATNMTFALAAAKTSASASARKMKTANANANAARMAKVNANAATMMMTANNLS